MPLVIFEENKKVVFLATEIKINKLAIVIPTYNERENIRELIEGVLRNINAVDIIIVDDNSPDGTGQILEELCKEFLCLKVIHRYGKKGRGLAGIDGFNYALKKRYRYILEMDADLSHDPRYIPEFLKWIETYEIVIGSRYIEGAKDLRGIKRRFLSKFAQIYIRNLLGITASDPASGYRCFKAEILDGLEIKSIGTGIILEVLFKCRNKKIKEIPIIFQDRKYNKSKLSLKSLLENFLLSLKLKCGISG